MNTRGINAATDGIGGLYGGRGQLIQGCVEGVGAEVFTGRMLRKWLSNTELTMSPSTRPRDEAAGLRP